MNFQSLQFLVIEKDIASTRKMIKYILIATKCTLQIISPFYHRSLKTNGQIQMFWKYDYKMPHGKGLFAACIMYIYCYIIFFGYRFKYYLFNKTFKL